MPSFAIFILITFLYLLFRNRIVDTYENRNDKSQNLWKMATLLYFLIFTFFQIKSNINATTEICGSVQWGTIMLWTIIPNVIIFGSLIAILQNFPGWKAPFANTIGYTIVQFSGLKDLLTEILRDKLDDDDRKDMKESTNKSNLELSKMLTLVYRDPTELINEITPTNWDDWLKKTPIEKIFKKEYRTGDILNNPHPKIKQLYNFVVQRDEIAEFIWLWLVGSFINGLQSNSLANLRCMGSSNKHKKEDEEWKAKQKEDEASKTKKVYYIKE